MGSVVVVGSVGPRSLSAAAGTSGFTPVISPGVAARTRPRAARRDLYPGSGEQSGEGGDHGVVAPVEPRPWSASLQHGQLMAQHEDLDLVGGVGSVVERYPAQQLGDTW